MLLFVRSLSLKVWSSYMQVICTSCTGLTATACIFLFASCTSPAFCRSEFCASAGQLHVFCLQAPALLDRLLASGRVQRLLSSPLPSPPPLQRGARRLSRSESDLYCFTGKEKALGSPRQHHNFMRHKAVLERSQSSSRTSATSDDYVQAIGGKVRMVSDLWRRAALPCNV